MVHLFAQPLWMNNPTNSQFYGGIGIVKDKTLRRVAILQARAELLETIKVEISSNTESVKSSISGNYTSEFKQTIVSKAEDIVKESYVKDTFTDSEGYYYVWVVVLK